MALVLLEVIGKELEIPESLYSRTVANLFSNVEGMAKKSVVSRWQQGSALKIEVPCYQNVQQ